MIKARHANQVGAVGIASQNMMEELLQKLELAQEADFNAAEEGGGTLGQKRPSLKFLEKARRGRGIVANKDFMQVLFITCFLPFIQPNFPALKDAEVKMARKNERKVAKLFEDIYHFDPEENVAFDYDQFTHYKDTVRDAMAKLQEGRYPPKSLYLQLYEDQVQRTQAKNAAFNQALNSQRITSVNEHWEQLPTNILQYD